MSDPAYEKKPGGWPDPQNEPPYPANSPYTESDPLTAPAPSTSTPVGYGAPPSVPPQYEAYYGPAGEGSYQNADAHVPQGIFIAPVQPANESDHLAYSIITMICCFLPLGIVALVFSIKTREANVTGNVASARYYSRMSLIFAHSAVGVGIAILILYLILAIHFNNKASQMEYNGS